MFGVDYTYGGRYARPYLTEINIGRFFTTIYFFAKAGLYMPPTLPNLALDGSRPSLERPGEPASRRGRARIRGMDASPALTTVERLNEIERIEGRWGEALDRAR